MPILAKPWHEVPKLPGLYAMYGGLWPRASATAHGPNLLRRGSAAAWEIYRLSTGAWLDHRVSDRFFSKAAGHVSRVQLLSGADSAGPGHSPLAATGGRHDPAAHE